MPAYHLIAPDRSGITLVNIGVGPSNAKTICDHLAVLRSEAWLMIGHCGGLRPTQKIGDYVLAHAYLRDDHVLDPVLPPEIPIRHRRDSASAGAGGGDGQWHRRRGPQEAYAHGHDRHDRRSQLGTALHPVRTAVQPVARGRHRHGKRHDRGAGLSLPRALRTLLCVSDKPLHGEIKMPGQANRFYEEAIAAHLAIGHHLRTAACRRPAPAQPQTARVQRASVPVNRSPRL
jgi:AMP nucleosidase